MTEEMDRISGEVKRRWFPHHCERTARLNHGSFGSAPTPVEEAQLEYRRRWRRQPDDVYFNETEKGIKKAREAVAAAVNCESDEVSLVDNCTIAGEIVMQHVMREAVKRKFAGEKPEHEQEYFLCHNWIYPGMAAVSRADLLLVGIGQITVDIPLPLPSSKDELDDLLLQLYEEALNSVPKGSVRLALLDHISSVPAMVFPVRRLVALCKEYDVQDTFVDGAHAIGQVTVDVADIGADYYCSNIHKWFFGSTSVAFLHCKRIAGKQEPHHIVASHNYGKGLALEASWIATKDYTAFQAVYDCFQFVNCELDPFLLESKALTDEEWEKDTFQFRYSAWNHKKFLAFAKILTDGWGTKLAFPEEASACLGMVELPTLPFLLKNGREAVQFRHFLRQTFDVETLVDAQPNADSNSGYCAYIRLSVMVYTVSEDIMRLRDAILLVKNGTSVFHLVRA